MIAGVRRRLIRIGRILAAFARLPMRDRLLLFEAAGLVGYVRVALWLLPFPRLRAQVEKLGRGRSKTGKHGPPAQRVGWAVRETSRVVPRASCLTQALAAQAMLGRRGLPARLHLGVARPDGDFEAHAWLESDGAVVVGAEERERYSPLVAWEQERGPG
jgi:hypothetical protein